MNFRVIRLVLATFGGKFTPLQNPPHAQSGVTVRLHSLPSESEKDESTKILIEASSIVSQIPSQNETISITDDVRRPLECALESYVDLVAVLNQCGRHIASPNPFIAIEPIDDESANWLAGKIIRLDTSRTPIRMWHQFDFDKAIPILSDRLDGVTLIAESLGHTHPTGRLHELMRFFERAFALSAGRISRDHLPKFLEQNGQGYTESEIINWIELRDKTAHADRRPDFALQSDTAPVVNRVEQAAYDVLFNKANWRDSSLSRRDKFRPYCGSSDATNSIFITQGGPAKISFSVLDGFNAYPLHLGPSNWKIPDCWLTKHTLQE